MPVSVHFYHLTSTPFERALPKLLEKIVGSGRRALVVASSESEVDRLNQLLWTYDPNSFLPHGSAKDGKQDKQPILLTTDMSPVNHANMLVVTAGQMPDAPEQFERILDIFDGKDAEAVEKARARWALYKSAGCELAYQKQTETGGWERKDQ